MTLISKEYHFCAAHRIEGHPKCGRLHGHNYRVVVELEGEIQEDGMVMDYGILDVIVKPLVDTWDHRYLVSESNVRANDPYIEPAVALGHAVVLPVEASTAELLAYALACAIRVHLGSDGVVYTNIRRIRVVIYETPKSMASCML